MVLVFPRTSLLFLFLIPESLPCVPCGLKRSGREKILSPTDAILDLKTAWKWYKVAYEREMENEEGPGS